MTEADRNEVLNALVELARRYPHWRIGQLIANVAGWADVDVWDVEDEQLLSTAQDHLRKIPDQGAENPPAEPLQSPGTAGTRSLKSAG